jgi:hypothetical protein
VLSVEISKRDVKDLSGIPSTSRPAGRNEQSSIRRETRPGVGAVGNAAVMYSTDFLSREFCDKSRNLRLSA